MSATEIILLAAVAILIAAVAWLGYRYQRAQQLKKRFGPEYTQAVRQYGSETRAQAALAGRERRMEKIHLHSLSREDHDRFLGRWETIQRGFVDDPGRSTREADGLVN